jgi:hypothetical protein
LCGQCQLAACDEVDLLRFAPNLQHDGAHRIAGQRVGGRPQRLINVNGADGDEKTRIKTKLGKPVHRDGPCFDFREILPDPNHGSPRGHAPCEPRDKAGRCRALSSGFRKHLVHRAQSQAALQAGIGFRMSERHLARGISRIMRLDAFDAAA